MIKNNHTPKLIFIFCLFLAFTFKAYPQTSIPAGNISETAKDSLNIEVKLFKTETGYGYDIYQNNKIYVHQPNIPAINGNKCFSNKEDALKVGNLVIKKIQKNITPPSISVHELDSLKIKK